MKLICIALFTAFVVFLAFPVSNGNIEPAEIVFKNGNIYTVDERQPHAEAIAVKAGHILYVGSNTAVQAYVGDNTRTVDLHGDTVLPGFTDSHHHLSGVGFREMTLNLEGSASLEE